MPSTQAFTKAYQALNKEQRTAVDHLDGPVMVVAGPGTGKTQVIALRIANILKKTDTDPDAVLALTFTESGARAMRERLVGLIGTPAYYVNVSTFHSFCVGVIRDNPDYFTLDPSAEPLSDLERLKLIHVLLDTKKLKLVKPVGAPYHYTKAILGAISDLKREGVDPTEFATVLDQEHALLTSSAEELSKTELGKRHRNLTKNRDLLELYLAYQQELATFHRFDFDDMINAVTTALINNEDLLRALQERFHYLLVDEYQDTNSAQNELLLLLASFWEQEANIMVTGDPDQCLPGDSLITTESGKKPLRDIKYGDKVLSAVGKGYSAYVPVSKVYSNTRRVKLITLTLETGEKITSTHNHKMFCFIPPREMTKYWYVYLMYQRNIGWRIGITRGLSYRLKLEGMADKIVGIKQCNSEAESKYYEAVYSLKYQIPTVMFKYRNNMISGEWLERLYKKFDTEENATKLANDLGINLSEPHYQRDGTTFGQGRTKINLYMNSRSYRSKYAKKGLLTSPAIRHEITIQTKNPKILSKLEKKGFKLRNQNIGKGLRIISENLAELYEIAKDLERELPGIIDIKSSIGTVGVQHKPTRIMQAGNVLVGNYLPVQDRFNIKYSQVVKKEEKYDTITTYDLEVYPSHNFIANGVVVHNSIMRFQGASIENQLSFIKVYPQAKVITLRTNYRSTQTILDAADSLISHNNLRISDVVQGVDLHLTSAMPPTNPAKGGGSGVRLAALTGSTAELVFLAEDIKGRLKQGAKAQEIAIIYRTNAESAAIADTLIRYGLDYSVQGGANVLEDPTVANFIRILRVVEEMHRRTEDEDLFTILHYELFGIAPLDVLKLARLAGSHKLTLFDVLAQPKLLDTLELDSRPALVDALALLSRFSHLDANHTFSETFELILNDSGYLDWVLQMPDSHHRLSRLNTLFDEVKRMNRADHRLNLKGFLDNLRLMEDNHLRLEESSYGRDEDAITLTTAHSAKGLEWDHVYLTRAVDGAWGNNRARDLLKLPESLLKNTDLLGKEKNEDERRLFYVALTRGRDSVTLTHAGEYRSFGTLRTAIPSMFLAEVGEANLTALDTTHIEQQSRLHLEKLLTSSAPAPDRKETAFLQTLVDDFALSVTALNTYLECPYKFKLDKLLRVPHSKKSHLAFGTAVHSALESFYREFLDSSLLPPKKFLVQTFETALDQEVLTSKDHALRLEQGREILGAYYDFFRDDFKTPLFLEKFFRVHLGDVTLTGKIDRIEALDPDSHTVKVIDYKTGQGRSRNYIEGKTKDSRGDLKRQLVFYKLLIDLDRRLQGVTFGQAELDFVGVPAEKNKSGRQSLTITTEEVKELKDTIREVISDIRALRFPRTKDLKPCATCDFRNHCWPDGIPQS